MAIFAALSSKNRPPATPSSPDSGRSATGAPGFRRYAWATLGLTLFVILFGAVVRITGSGAGCGQHWPSCNGEVVHLPRRLETIIELTHRVTSGLALLFVVGLVVFAVRTHPPGGVRTASYVALAFMVVEALIGAALVLFGLVDQDASLGRALVMPAHLVSTYALTAALFFVIRRSNPASTRDATLLQASSKSTPARDVTGGHEQTVGRGATERGGAVVGEATTLGGGTAASGSAAWSGSVALGALVILLISATGAITALGDTLYPPSASTLAGRVAEDQGVTATLLQRLRVAHPVLAVLGGALLARLGAGLARGSGLSSARRGSRTLTLTIVAQLLFGTANIWFSAPGAMQVAHLALALGVWLAFVALALETGSAP